ncbi:tetratricopeptide repeat protein [Geopsychrobacter electrodiphilus]|uniref:tetratricopeptide repeat protein n=1 Tax=Geopsychrobacter electrodiphilus TaxID=225196 RepID=UPI0003A63A28|nr:tetratricopeptide repeat protein [Geopsychrobacter electrodiphilus]
MDVFPFHLVNLTIHVLTTLFVFLCLTRVFRASLLWPWVAAGIFALHPLQTQAVTYIVQRSTCLSGLFLFMALYCYIKAVEGKGDNFLAKQHLLPYAGYLISGALAVITKQNAATIPFLFLIFDYFFLRPKNFNFRKNLAYVSPLLIVPILIGASMVLIPMLAGSNWQTIGNFEQLRSGVAATPLNYFATELSVFWLYLRLLCIPVHQVLDYAYPLVHSIFNLTTLASLAGIIALFGIAVAIRRKWPTLLFFLLWMTVALAVESSIIPLDPIFEHRLYVPLFGFAILVVDLLTKISPTKSQLAAATALAMVLGFLLLSYNRNSMWADPLQLYTNDVAYGYGSYRSQIMLADTLFKRGDLQNAKENYDQVAASIDKGGLGQANDKMLVNLAISYGRFNDFPKAEALLRLALKKNARSPEAHYNLGIALYLQNRQVEALRHFTITRELQPGNMHALFYYLLISAALQKNIDYSGLLKELSQRDQALADTLKPKLPMSSF